MKKNLLVILCLCVSILAQAKSYNIVDYGAVSDGQTLATAAINSAIEQCSRDGGGRVTIPRGDFLSGTIIMKDNVELHLDRCATLIASTNLEDMPLIQATTYRSLKDLYGWAALIYANGAENIAITGSGSIQGQGSRQPSHPELPAGDMDGRCRNLLLVSCKQVRVEGIKMYNSGIWNQHYLDCEDVIIDKIYVYNNERKNNDGIDIDGCRRLILSNSIIDANDDGIVLKSTGPAACEDITITGCVISSWCNGIKAGTESTGGFRNIAISNCVITPSMCDTNYNHLQEDICWSGISLELVDGGVMEGVTITNIVTEGAQAPLFIRLGNRARKHHPDAPEPKMGVMRNIIVDNFIAYNMWNLTSSITAVEGSYIENVSITNMQFRCTGGVTLDNPNERLRYKKDIYSVQEREKSYPNASLWRNLPASAFFIRHVKNLIIKDVMVTPDAEDPRVPVIAHDVHGLILGDFFLSENITSPLFFKAYDVTNYKVATPIGWAGEVVDEEVFDPSKCVN